MVKCELCNSLLNRAYIRESLEGKRRNWKGIGYFCLKCKQFYTIQKNEIIIQKNENIQYSNIQ